MSFVNLSLAEFLALFTAVSAAVVALYMLDRSRRRLTVATLRFWNPAQHPVETTRRRRIRQWASLLLQIAGIACLLLALAQLRWGRPDNDPRDHVLILDTSAWMGARTSQGPLIDRARAAASAYLRAVPAADRVMIVYADALATPVTAFETNRRKLSDIVRDARPSPTALRVRAAIEMAAHIQKLHSGSPGEIVFVGAGRVHEEDVTGWRPPPNLRVLPIRATLENTGLRKVAVRRSVAESDLWQVFVSAQNYGSVAKTVDLTLSFGGAPVGSRRLRLAPGVEQEAEFEFRTRAAGWVEARLRQQDALAEDDRVVVELPSHQPLKIAVCSDQPDLWRPLLAAHPAAEATFLPAANCNPGGQAIALLDGFLPASPPATHLILVEPPSGGSSPIRVRTQATGVTLQGWRTDHPLGAGLHTRDLRIDNAQIFEAAPGDVAVAETSQGAIILARAGNAARPYKTVAIGFHPMRTQLRFELTTPLLFANIVRWLAGDSFRQTEVHASGLGTVAVRLDEDLDSRAIEVRGAGGPLPFTLQQRMLRFHAGREGGVEVLAGGRRFVYSLSLPELAQHVWQPPKGVRAGLPSFAATLDVSRELWHWLAVLGALLLALEWTIYGRSSVMMKTPRMRVLRVDLPRRWQKTRKWLRRAS